ncbi:MAG: MFS transporter, partial [Chitinophagaceae bacterium]
LIGLVPGYKTIGIAAPLLVLLLRLIQGLALGGEYGGAATYVAEHSPAKKRGYYTSWIQTTATLGLFVALGVIMLVKMNMSDDSFNAEWGGWRYPFWISILLVAVSVYIRLKMAESPLFSKLKAEGKTSVNPLKESFRRKGNFKMVLLALFGAVMGQGVIWYTGQFYAQSFLENICKIEFGQSRTIMLWAIAFATPFFLFFGWLSDKVGRKWIMMAGMLLGILTYRPIFNAFLKDSETGKEFLATTINAGDAGFTKHSEISSNKNDSVIVYSQTLLSLGNFQKFTRTYADTIFSDVQKTKSTSPVKIINKHLNQSTYWKFVSLVFLLILYVTMVYGPIAAFLVEMFPTKIRYTSMSLPYHIGNGVFGGLVPFIGLLLTTTYPKDPLVGLWYPIGIAVLCLIIGTIYLTNKVDKDVAD